MNAMPVQRATGGLRIMAHILPEKQGSVLTNQCLGKEQMNAEQGGGILPS